MFMYFYRFLCLTISLNISKIDPLFCGSQTWHQVIHLLAKKMSFPLPLTNKKINKSLEMPLAKIK